MTALAARPPSMEGVKTFLESSTVHGLSYISTTRRLVRLFWIIIVAAGFTGASVLIYQSFQDWSDNPITTTIETRPIKEIKFPKVTVCPPRHTYTDLNYDLMVVENLTLHNDTRDELVSYAKQLLYDDLYERIMTNLSALDEKDKFRNWYHGYTAINLPYYDCDVISCPGLVNEMETSAISGTIAIKQFGDKFDPEKVVKNVKLTVFLDLPPTNQNQNATLHLEIDKRTMKDLSTGQDLLRFMEAMPIEDMVFTHVSFNF